MPDNAQSALSQRKDGGNFVAKLRREPGPHRVVQRRARAGRDVAPAEVIKIMVNILARAQAAHEALTAPMRGRGAAEAAHDVVGRTAVGQAPMTDLAVTPDGRTVVVGHFGNGSVSLVDSERAFVKATVAGRGEPIAVAATDHWVFVGRSAPSFDMVSMIDIATGSLIADYPLSYTVRALEASRNGRQVYVGRVGDRGADIAVLDTTTGDVEVIDLGSGPGSSVDVLRLGRNGRRLYAANSTAFDGEIAVVDVRRARVTDTIEIGAPIRDIATIDGSIVYVLSFDPDRGGVVHIINTARDAVTAELELGGFPSQFVLSADGELAYIVDRDTVAVLCLRTNEIVDTITVAGEPSGVAVHPDGAKLYVADYAGYLNLVSVAAGFEPFETFESFDRLEPVAV